MNDDKMNKTLEVMSPLKHENDLHPSCPSMALRNKALWYGVCLVDRLEGLSANAQEEDMPWPSGLLEGRHRIRRLASSLIRGWPSC